MTHFLFTQLYGHNLNLGGKSRTAIKNSKTAIKIQELQLKIVKQQIKLCKPQINQ